MSRLSNEIRSIKDLNYLSRTAFYIDLKTNEVYRVGYANISYWKSPMKTYTYIIDKDDKIFRLKKDNNLQYISRKDLEQKYPEYFL